MSAIQSHSANSRDELPRSSFVVGTLLFVLVVTFVIAAGVEYRFYQACVRAEYIGTTEGMGLFGKFLFFWVLWAKSLIVIAPAIVVANLLACRGMRQTGWFVFNVSLILFCYWIAVDLYVYYIANNHVLEYRQFLLHPQHWQWAGSDRPIISIAVLLLAIVGGVVLAATILGRVVTRQLARRIAPATQRRVAGCILLLYGVVVLGYSPATYVVDGFSRPVVRLLENKLPFQLPFTTAGVLHSSGELRDLDRAANEQYAISFPQISHAQPLEESLIVPRQRRPNVILFVLESLRQDVLAPSTMPNLNRLADEGLSFTRHHSSSNMSHFGLFSLLYGRSPLVYNTVLDAGLPPSLCHTLHRSGYETTFITSGDCTDFQRMEEFLSDETFDNVIVYREGSWSERDRRLLQQVDKIANSRKGRVPQLVVCFLMSTHFSYSFPPEYARHKPYSRDVSVMSSELRVDPEPLRNRYLNAAGFLDAEIAATVARLDQKNNLVVVTGDHGESFYDDGKLFHGSRLSNAQTQVPLFMWGTQVPTRKIASDTTHCDLFPTLLSLLTKSPAAPENCHGRNVLTLDGRSGENQILLVHGVHNPNVARHHDRLLLVKGDLRLPFLLSRNTPGVEVFELVDTNDRIRFDTSLNRGERALLLEGLTRELERLGGRKCGAFERDADHQRALPAGNVQW